MLRRRDVRLRSLLQVILASFLVLPAWGQHPGAPPDGAEEIVCTDCGEVVSFGEMVDDLAAVPFVLVGESHDQRAHHVRQLRVVAALWARGRDVAVGMEMFQRPFQEALDLYVAGEIDEEEFLDRSEYRKRWGFPYDLYRPILRFARGNGVPVIALNAPMEISRTVGRSGLAGLTEEQRASLPRIHLDLEDHREHWMNSMGGMHGGMSETAVSNYYEAMCVWDDTMAYSAARYWTRDPSPQRQVVIIAGRGHVEYGFGIADRIRMRTGGDYRTVVLVNRMPPGEEDEGEDLEAMKTPEVADYLWILPPPKPGENPPQPRYPGMPDDRI